MTLSALEKELKLLKLELAKLRASEKSLRNGLQLSPMALCHHDRELRYIWSYNLHLGFSPEEVAGKTDWDILDKDLADRMGEIKRRVLKTGIAERADIPTVLGDVNAQYFDLSVEPLRDEHTQDIIGLSCCGIDVTEDRRRRESYRTSEKNLQFIFNASPMPIVVLHAEKKTLLFFNPAAKKTLEICESGKQLIDKLGIRDHIGQHLSDEKSIEELKLSFRNQQDTEIFFTGIGNSAIFQR